MIRFALRGRGAAIPVLLGTFYLSVYFFTASNDLKHNGDTFLRYQTTQALVDYHQLWLPHPMTLDTRVAVGRGHHIYAFYAPGQALLMAPLYIAGKIIAHHLSLPYEVTTLYASRSLDLFLGALLVVLFYGLSVSVGYGTRVSVALTLIFGLATAAWPDAQSALEQTQVNVFLLAAVLAVAHFIRSDLVQRHWLAAAGTAIGICFLTRYDALIYAPVLLGYVAYVRCKRGGALAWCIDGLIYCCSLAPWIVGVGLWNYLRFDSVFLTGLHEQTLGEPPWDGLAGLLVSPGKGLIWYVPFLILLPWAWRTFQSRTSELFPLLALMCALPLVFYSNVLYWHGDPAWGPRYLYTALPYLVLPFGEILLRWRNTKFPLKTAFVGLVIVSFVVQVCAVSVTQWRFWYRLQVKQQQSVPVGTWGGEPFRWGASHYGYYWNIAQSPLWIQMDNVYQVARLAAGSEQYGLSVRPDPLVSNPVSNYAVNTFAFWWLDESHPLLGKRTRFTLALALLAGAAVSFLLLLRCLEASRFERRRGAAEPEHSLETVRG